MTTLHHQTGLPFIATLVSSISVGSPIQKGRVFIEHIPGRITHVVGKPINQTPDSSRPVNDSCAYKTLNDAIVDAQHIGSRLVNFVEPQNLLFIFSQSKKAMLQISLTISEPEDFTNLIENDLKKADQQENDASQQPSPYDSAIVFCHVSETETLQQLSGAKQHEGQDKTHCYQVLWSEFQNLKDAIQNFSGHLPSVGDLP